MLKVPHKSQLYSKSANHAALHGQACVFRLPDDKGSLKTVIIRFCLFTEGRTC